MYRVGSNFRHGVSLGADYKSFNYIFVAVELYVLFSCAKGNGSCTCFHIFSYTIDCLLIKFHRRRAQTRAPR